MSRHRYARAVTLIVLATTLRPACPRALPRLAVAASLGTSRSPAEASASWGETALDARRPLRMLRVDGRRKWSQARPGGIHLGPWGLGAVLRCRGGASGLEAGLDEGSEGSEDDDDDETEEDISDDGFLDEEVFGEATLVERLGQEWKKTPVITRTFFQASVSLAFLTAFLNNNEWPHVLLLDWKHAVFRLQLWRLVTPFLYLGPFGLNYFLTAHFSWTYMSQLEKLHYREPHTFVMLLAFGMISLLLLTLVTGAGINASYTIGHSLSCFMVMIWSRKFSGTRVSVLEMFELRTELLPYFFVAQTLMMEGTIPWVDISGLFIGYAWQTLSLKGLVKAPKPLVNLFRGNAFLKAEYARAGKEYGQEIPVVSDDDDQDDDDGTLASPASSPAEAGEEGLQETSDRQVQDGARDETVKRRRSLGLGAAWKAASERMTGLQKGAADGEEATATAASAATGAGASDGAKARDDEQLQEYEEEEGDSEGGDEYVSDEAVAGSGAEGEEDFDSDVGDLEEAAAAGDTLGDEGVDSADNEEEQEGEEEDYLLEGSDDLDDLEEFDEEIESMLDEFGDELDSDSFDEDEDDGS